MPGYCACPNCMESLAAPCGRSWAPRTCRSTATSAPARLRSPIDHMCMKVRALPHICVCVRCGHPPPPGPIRGRQ